PDLMEVAAAARNAVFLPYGHVDVAATPVVPPRAGPVRFLHLPSVRDVKGTELFENAVGELKAAGVSCSLTVADSVSNDEAARLIAGHDVLLDQLRVGWYGGVAVEAMAAGKPVVAHIVDADLPRIPAQMAADLPVVRARPDTVADVLRSVAGWTEQERAAASERSRAFAERWHMPQAVARQVLDAYEAARQE
ncbi:MAG: glycosyltransferase family 1 protein, partial [Anaerolineae bacterium]|nr:glycosyltransferase family 1 protein [Anaerolineae bacterium]